MKMKLAALCGVLSLLTAVVACEQDAQTQDITAREQAPEPREQTKATSAPEPGEQSEAKGAGREAGDVPSMRDLDEGPPEHLTYRPEDIEWQQGPDSFEEGAMFSILEGNPSEPGVFTLQLKLPDGFVINPHWHPNVERVTVLKGTFRLGSGEEVDRQAAEALPVGTYTSMPPRMVHHAIADGETVVQLTTVGPWEINYVDPQHDPRRRTE